jgi:ubiquinone/menaquinone biosynthesis C-methylase UbiE
MTEDTWAGLADQFLDYYSTVQGRVRTHVIDRQLRRHLPPAPARLIDVGGGAGHQALPLARDGYDVTIVEPSAGMLERAEESLAAEREDVRGRVTLVNAPGEDALAAVDGRRFAGVLCHAVIQYVDDPRPILSQLALVAADLGVVSIVAKNQVSMPVPLALAGRWSDARAAFANDKTTCGLGVDTRADTVEDLSNLLIERSIDPTAWYGVGFFTDWWDSRRPAEEADDDMLAVELEASVRDPYRQLGRMFHLVGIRRDATPDD